MERSKILGMAARQVKGSAALKHGETPAKSSNEG
jgi:hypothetical protein